ncbi:MAG: DUF2177 family protein [Anaerosomatales bacterium]
MTKIVQLYLLTTVVFFAIDFVWLSTVAQSFYQNQIGPLLKSPFNLPVAAGFYLFYIVGILVFAVIPGMDKGGLVDVVWRGALFGALAYGTYDLTNLATLEGYTWQVAAVDMVWGTVLTGTVSAAGYYIARLLNV